MNFRAITILIGLFVTAGCGQHPAASSAAPQVESKRIEPDDPEVVRSVERMLATNSTDAQKWVETHQPAWGPGIKRIYDRGDADLEPVQKALWDLLTEQEVREQGQTITSRYTVLYLN
jgi:hypothetical protein